MFKTLTSVALWAALGWLLGAWLSPSSGWMVFSLGLIAMLLARGAQLARISIWSRDVDAPPPPSLGPWDNVLAPVYRRLRGYRDEVATLNHQLERLLLAAEALPDGVVTLDADMAVTWCNQTASEHIGLHLETDRGHSLFNILRAPEFLRYASQAHRPGPLTLHTHVAGQEKTLCIHLIPYGVAQFLMVTRDITQMEKLETVRRDFVANVSHELGTPLTVLSGFLETLRDMPTDALNPEQRNRYQDLMMAEAQRMQALVADLLALSTLESSPLVQGETVHVAAIIHAALAQAKALSDGAHAFVERIAQDLCVIGVQTELASAISNLLTNAVRYTPEGGTITVRWQRISDGSAWYAVEDTGIGIAAADIPRLAERFYRVDRSRSRATGGTGLGLAITKHAALRHDAKLHIQSRYGVGSTFSLEFPAARVRTMTTPPCDLTLSESGELDAKP